MASPLPELELRHYAAVREELSAAEAARALRGRGLVVEGQRSHNGWRLIVRPTVDRFDIAAAELVVQTIASEFAGVYPSSRIVRVGSPI